MLVFSTNKACIIFHDLKTSGATASILKTNQYCLLAVNGNATCHINMAEEASLLFSYLTKAKHYISFKSDCNITHG